MLKKLLIRFGWGNCRWLMGGETVSPNLIMVCLLAGALFCTSAQAQTRDPEKIAAVMGVISLFILARENPIPRPDGQGVELALSERSPEDYTVTENLYAEFDLQRDGVEVCFIVESDSPLPANAFFVEVNGDRFPASLGENCFAISEEDQRSVNYVNVIVNQPGVSLTLSTLELSSQNALQLQLPRVTRGEWTEQAVRKVLKIFAFGGHATDAQILEWSEMSPQIAIQEMLNFDQHNLKLSPLAEGEIYTETATEYGTFSEFISFISSSSSNLPIPINDRDQFGLGGFNFDDTFNRMTTVRGLNPFRQKIGFWETNYHLAVNRDVGVDRDQIAVYYDLIMEAHEAGLPYHEILGLAAKSAAVAEQYGHDRNQWRFDRNLDEFFCNCHEDFAREVHQLFYGIYGTNDPNHETVTIPETAKMLTDMDIDDSNVGIEFGVEFHHREPVTIFGQPISGARANDKIDNLMKVSIEHPESLYNLPVMIISVLADDSLNDAKSAQLRRSWASMGSNKNLLRFIQAYAVSELFHSPDHFKFLTSHERSLYLANKNNLDNLEAYFGGLSFNGGRAGIWIAAILARDGAGEFFRPLNNVFGGQTSLEASDSALAFENNYNQFTDDERFMREIVLCSGCDLGDSWEKKWSTVLPQRSDGQYYVEDVAAWLWNHAVGSFDNFSDLERAHLYSLLGSARIVPDNSADGDNPLDFNLLMCMAEDYQIKEEVDAVPLDDLLFEGNWDNYCRPNDDDVSGYSDAEIAAFNRVYTGQSIRQNPLAQDLLEQLGSKTIPLNATTGHNDGETLRKHALERINATLGFIFTTPFVFAEGQQ